MSLASKINRSRYVLTEYLKDEWDTSVITQYSDKDITNIYLQKVPKSQGIAGFGEAVGCNFTLQNRTVPSHSLHVIYYNFGELHDPPKKVTKKSAESLRELYQETISPDDSLLVIFQSPLTANIQKAFDNLYIQNQEYLNLNHLSDALTEQNQALGEEAYSQEYFRSVHAFCLDHLQFDIREHERVPRHTLIRNREEIQNILNISNATLEQLPVIQRNDIQAKVMRMAPGDVCEISRRSSVGVTRSYRVCR